MERAHTVVVTRWCSNKLLILAFHKFSMRPLLTALFTILCIPVFAQNSISWLATAPVAHKIYGKTDINERHRHRYEFNNEYTKLFKDAGMVLSGLNPNAELAEIVEIPTHPFFIGVQFHPEYKSTVENPHPLFVSFVKACLGETV